MLIPLYEMYDNKFYKKSNKSFAQKLRQNMTKAEACLWKYALCAGKMKGYSFKRQRPILNYIADFVCIDLNLVIEVDGYSHFLNEVVEKDKLKDKTLKEAGFVIMRITDDQVLKNMANVILEIEKVIDEIEVHKSPPPAPSKGGHRHNQHS